jgi:hypothetical protein
VLSALGDWCDRNEEEVYVITRDQKMQDGCTPEAGLYPLRDITDFLDLANEHEDVAADRIKAIFRSRAASLSDDVGEKFQDLGFAVHDYYADVEIDSVDEIEFGDAEIVSIDDNQATIEAECDVTFTASITYEDPDTGIWDSEDKRMYFTESVERTVTDTAYASVEIHFQYESLASLANPEEPTFSVMGIVAEQPIMLSV